MTSQNSCSFNITISSLISWLSTETARVCLHPAKFLALIFCGKELHNTNLTQLRVKNISVSVSILPSSCFTHSPHSHISQIEVHLDSPSLIMLPLTPPSSKMNTDFSISFHKRLYFYFFFASLTTSQLAPELPLLLEKKWPKQHGVSQYLRDPL